MEQTPREDIKFFLNSIWYIILRTEYFYFFAEYVVSRTGVVSIATILKAEQSEVQIPVKTKLFSETSGLALGRNRPPIQWTSVLLLVGKRGRNVNSNIHSHLILKLRISGPTPLFHLSAL